MSWEKLLQENKVHRHTTSRKELTELRRFATAYNAALQTAKMAIACAGYRIASIPGHHRLTFEGVKLALGESAGRLADSFDACRRKRNEIDYTGAVIATTTEADEILLHAKSFSTLVEGWIASTHRE
jgi:hypothetical protein